MKIKPALIAILILAGAAVFAQADTVRVADGTPIHVRLKADLVSAQVAEGARVDLEVARPVTLNGVVVIPQGAVVWGAVQTVKAGKALRFDVEGLRLPDLKTVKLRCSPQRKKDNSKDEIKVESRVGADLGAAKGSEFTAYLDEDLKVEVAGAPITSPPTAPVAPVAPVAPPVAKVEKRAPVAPPAAKPPAPVQRVAVTQPVTPAPVTAPPAVSPQAPAPPVSPIPPAGPAEYITVECFSDPLGADILIDGDFHGSTPSILKILPGNHQLVYQLAGYKEHTENLVLAPASGVHTVQVTFEKRN
jgi:hypothetical protein